MKQFKHDDVTDRAAALTYFGVLALLSVLGPLGKDHTDKLLANIKGIAPRSVVGFLKTIIEQV